MAQTLEQRRRNAKFVKDQEARRGKSEEQIKKRTKEAPKSPISMFWLGMSRLPKSKHCPTSSAYQLLALFLPLVMLGFVVFGGLVFEALSRFFGL
ncbi:hypothetical protein ACQKWADRAFT_283498 [Trichoderma austrokoningii]